MHHANMVNQELRVRKVCIARPGPRPKITAIPTRVQSGDELALSLNGNNNNNRPTLPPRN